MRQFLSSLILIFLLLAGMAAHAAEALPRLTVYIQDASEGLSEIARVHERFKGVLRDKAGNRAFDFRVINVANRGSMTQCERHLKRVDHLDLFGIFPVVILGGDDAATVRAGDDAIDLVLEAIRRKSDPGDAPGDIAPGDSVILYFYKEDCPYCKELRPLMEAIPETITLPGGATSRVRVIWLDKNEPDDFEAAARYYELMDIPSARQYVPMVVIGNQSLYLYDEIVPNLLTLLLNGEGLQTPLDPLL